jgi:hypothetical protein
MELAFHCGLRIPTTPYLVPVLYLSIVCLAVLEKSLLLRNDCVDLDWWYWI